MNINLTLIGQSIVFAIFVWFCMKFIWPPIVAAMTERKKKIADGLAAAEQGHRAQELAQKEADKFLAESREQAAEIINKANQRSNSMVNEAKDKAKVEADGVLAKAEAEISSEINTAREKLRADVSGLVLSGVKQIVGREVQEADHKDILSGLSAKL